MGSIFSLGFGGKEKGFFLSIPNNMFPKMSPIAPHFYHICFNKIELSYMNYKGGPKGSTSMILFW